MKVKICGLMRLDDAQAAQAAGADLLGFIFYPPSRRYIPPEAAAAIIAAIPGAVAVGVFVNESEAHIREIVRLCGLSRVQLHGQESPAMVAALAAFQPIKAIPLKPENAGQLDAFGSAAILVDTPTADHGGSGIAGDWELAADWSRRRQLLLSGGLRPDTVAAAIRRVRPSGVDVASGVESAPGIKNHAAITAFVRAAREAL